jgi:tRNA A-37 threonylcarbamoyl transferase component Bud32
MKYFSHAGYRFGANTLLPEASLDRLVACFRSPGAQASHRLGGRGSVSRIHLDPIGPVVVKTFRRGGFLAHGIKRTYLRIGKTRAQAEFEQLETAGELGIRTPQPVAFAHKGGLFYQNWLATLEIPSVETMAQISRTNPQRIPAALESLGRQVALLMDHGILHADFHPGNVLVDNSGTVYLVDFDKTKICGGNRQRFRLRYQRRWCRAVKKHGLPESLCENIQTWLV